METVDPLTSLSSNKLAERAAAGRDLSKVGTLDVLPRLVDLAQRDPSPAVRLTCSGAAADILSRHRVGPRALELDDDRRRRLFGLIKGVDPGVNAGLFSMFGALGLPESFQQIAVGLRDPRGAVRVGASVGLMRLCVSEATLGDEKLEEGVVALLRDRRLKPDSLAEVGRVCAAVGYLSARRPLSELSLSGVFGEAVSSSLDVLRAAEAPLTGAWRTDGRDAGEVNPEPSRPAGLWAFAGDAAVEAGPEGWTGYALPVNQRRRMYIRRVGEGDSGPAAQALGHTLYPAPEADVLDAIDRATRAESLDGLALPTLESASEADRIACRALSGTSTEGPWLRASGLLLARAGERDAAYAAFEAATQAKKASADTWFFLGELAMALGRTDEARVAWEAFLKKEKRKRAPLVERAQARLNGLAQGA